MGIVSANDSDPEQEFGIEVQIDSIDPGSVFPEIVHPFFSQNLIKAPDIGQVVLVVLPADLPDGGFEGEEIALNEFSENAFYLLRGFDSSTIGSVPAILKQNYPKRSGFWLQNGTVIVFDETKGEETILIRLTDGAQGITIDKDGVTILSQQKIRLGDGVATEALHKGTQANTDLLSFLNAWLALLTPLSTSIDPAVIAYANAMKLAATGPIEILKAALPGWLSQKTFLDI